LAAHDPYDTPVGLTFRCREIPERHHRMLVPRVHEKLDWVPAEEVTA
jgi:hypothetical protein